jgi:hypothetical protein
MPRRYLLKDGVQAKLHEHASLVGVDDVRSCRRQGLPDCRGAGTSVRGCMPHRSIILTAELIAGDDAEGGWREPGQDDPGAAGVLDLDPGPEMGASPGSSSGPDPGRRPCPGTPRRSRPPRPRPPGRRRMRLPGASILLFRHHAERRKRFGRTRADPPDSVRELSCRPRRAMMRRAGYSAQLGRGLYLLMRHRSVLPWGRRRPGRRSARRISVSNGRRGANWPVLPQCPGWAIPI